MPRPPPRRRLRRRSAAARSSSGEASSAPVASGSDDVHADVDAWRRRRGNPRPSRRIRGSPRRRRRDVPEGISRTQRLAEGSEVSSQMSSEPVDVLRRAPRSARADDDELVAGLRGLRPRRGRSRVGVHEEVEIELDVPSERAVDGARKRREVAGDRGAVGPDDAVLAGSGGHRRDELAGLRHPGRTPARGRPDPHCVKSANSGPETVTRTIGGATRSTRRTVARRAVKRLRPPSRANRPASVSRRASPRASGIVASLMSPANHSPLSVGSEDLRFTGALLVAERVRWRTRAVL